MPEDPTNIIAEAIRGADKRYFFEDYTAQARAVTEALRQRGMVIVPGDPTEPMMEAGRNSLTYGAQRPADLLRNTWRAMVKAGLGR